MGIAFKENTDDMRNSISLKLIKKLIKNDNKLTVHDSLAFQKLKEKIPIPFPFSTILRCRF